MDVNDPAMLGGIETQMMASMLDYGVQFLDSIPDEANAKLAQLLVRDMRRASSGGVWDQEKMQESLSSWFLRGRTFEFFPEELFQEGFSPVTLFLDPVPAPAGEAIQGLKELGIQRFFDRHGGEDAFCRLMWLWFQWGRSYQKGNHSESPTLPS